MRAKAKSILKAAVIAAIGMTAFAGLARAADPPPRFWNLTAHTIIDFRLAPTGTEQYGINQCVNDKDGAVDNDERLRLTGLAEGVYDAKLIDKNGRICKARKLTIKPGLIFSLEEKDLEDCAK